MIEIIGYAIASAYIVVLPVFVVLWLSFLAMSERYRHHSKLYDTGYKLPKWIETVNQKLNTPAFVIPAFISCVVFFIATLVAFLESIARNPRIGGHSFHENLFTFLGDICGFLATPAGYIGFVVLLLVGIDRGMKFIIKANSAINKMNSIK